MKTEKTHVPNVIKRSGFVTKMHRWSGSCTCGLHVTEATEYLAGVELARSHDTVFGVAEAFVVLNALFPPVSYESRVELSPYDEIDWDAWLDGHEGDGSD